MDAIVDKTWTDERIKWLKELWQEGHSASSISQEIFGNELYRNSIIGKIHRLKLSGRKVAARPKGQPKPRLQKTAKPWRASEPKRDQQETGELAPAPLPPENPAEIPMEQRRTLLQLTHETCRWPYGDPATPEFFFCGASTATAQPYCAGHCGIAFNGAPPTKNYNPDNSKSNRPRYDETNAL